MSGPAGHFPSSAGRTGWGWAPVVYGRTKYVDTWWRALPEDVDADTGDWLRAQVKAVVAGGVELDGGPRFLLAQNARHRVVGAAVKVAQLGTAMDLDSRGGLYCFVGWFAARNAAPPLLAGLRAGYRGWAAQLYEDVMRPVWEESGLRLQEPRTSTPAPPPWPAALSHPIRGLTPLAPSAQVPDTWPYEGWDYLWAAAAQSPDQLTCVIGWPRATTARFEGVTHLGAAEAPRREIPRLPHAEAPPAPDPAPPASHAGTSAPGGYNPEYPHAASPGTVAVSGSGRARRRRAIASAVAALLLAAAGFALGRLTAAGPAVPVPSTSTSPSPSKSPSPHPHTATPSPVASKSPTAASKSPGPRLTPSSPP
jgi:hypothetical protein